MKPKRLISLLVAVCMMITMLPLSAVTAFAADTATEQEAIVDGYKYKYKVNGGNATITKFLGPVDSEGNVDSTNDGPYNITIPDKLGGCPVTGLGEYSFSGYLSAAQSNEPYQFGRNIHSVTIPQSVTSIGDYAFSHCEKMDSLTINDATTSIGDWAFDECYKLTTLSLGKILRRSAIMPFWIAIRWITSPFHQASLPSARVPFTVAMRLQRFR